MTDKEDAITQVAITTGEAIKAAEELGGFFNRIFGSLIEDSVGILADKVKYMRAERLAALQQKTEKKLQDSGVSQTVPVPPKIGIPLLEHASIEDNEPLHTKWANLLAHAMTPGQQETVHKSFVSTLSELEPRDVLVFDEIVRQYLTLSEEEKKTALFSRDKIVSRLNINSEDVGMTLRNLIRLGCLKPGTISGGVMSGSHALTSYKDIELVGLTELGLRFYQAVS